MSVTLGAQNRRAWDFPDSIVTMAYTGMAALGCLGRTIHSFFSNASIFALSKDRRPCATNRLIPTRHDVNWVVGGRSFSMKLCTYQLVPSYVLTVNNIQGSTLDWIILGTLHHSSRKSFSAALLFLPLACAQTLGSLSL